MFPAHVYRVSAGVTTLVSLASLSLDLAAWTAPDAVAPDSTLLLLAQLAVASGPLWALQTIAGAELITRRMHPLLLEKSRRMFAIGAIGLGLVLPLSLTRALGAGAEPALSALTASVSAASQVLMLALAALNARDGFRFRSLSHRLSA